MANQGNFRYNGGDCCESTCYNIAENRWGVVGAVDGIADVQIGFHTSVIHVLMGGCEVDKPCYESQRTD
jgi:hypothetical protein